MRYAWVFVFFVVAGTDTLAAEGTKFPVPTRAELAEPYKLIQEVFGDQFKAAEDAQAKSDLAMKLLTTATTTKNQFEKYALIQLAQQLAIAAEDQHLYFRTLETMGEVFQVDKVKLWAATIMQQVQVDELTACQLAELDFSASSDGAKRVDAADAWYDLATKLKGPAAQIAKDRAVLHYRAAMPGLKGLTKLRAQKRIQECLEESPASVPAQTSATETAPKPTTGRYGHGRIIEIDCTKGLSFQDAQKGQRNAARAYGVPVEIKNKIGMTFHFIPAGSFLMGSPDNEKHHKPDEKLHVAKVAEPFYISVTEVTQLQYWKVTGQKPSEFNDRPNNPVEMVSFEEAKVFCEKLSKLDKKRTYRLPTETEWEYACRAGTLEATYGPVDKIAWHKGNSDNQMQPVGQFIPNAWGLYDCIGNAWEWVQDEREPSRFQCRGGAWVDRIGSDFLRAAKRLHWGGPTHALSFRVLCTVEP